MRLTWWTAGAVLALAGCCCAKRGGSVGGSKSVPTATSVSEPEEPPKYVDHGVYKKGLGGATWGNLSVSPTITRSELSAVAKHFHRQNPKLPFHIFTDYAGVEKYVKYDSHYGTPQAGAYPYPKAWAEKHYVGMVNCMIAPGGCNWELHQGTAMRFGSETMLEPL